MAETKSIDDQIKDIQAQAKLLQEQTTLLTNQTKLMTEQATNQANRQVTQALIEKVVADKTKEVVQAEVDLEKVRAKAPFAELLGIKEALASLAIQSKEGAITVNKGTDGALLLGAMKEMLEALDSIAQRIIDALPPDRSSFVIASKGDIESAYKSDLMLKRINRQIEIIKQATNNAKPKETALEGAGPELFPGILAGAESVGLAFGALNDLSKFFRVDRSLSVFEGSDEAQQMLELLLEARLNQVSKQLTIRLDEPTSDFTSEATALLDRVNELKTSYDQASNLAADLQKQAENAAALPSDVPKPNLPTLQSRTALIFEIENTKLLLDGIHPSKNPDAFWTQVTGQVKQKRIGDKIRLMLTTKAQTVVTQEKRTWRPDRLLGSGEIQVQYRVIDPDGRYLTSGVLLKTTPTRNAYDANKGYESKMPR